MINARLFYLGLSTICQQYQCPDDCGIIKNQGRQYRHLAAREVIIVPWHTVLVDLIGPWTTLVNGQELEFKVLTIIDTVTNLLEIVRIDNKKSRNIAQLFANIWLSQYLWPAQIIHDNGREFIGYEFQDMMRSLGITSKPTTVKNLQSNVIVKRLHKTMADILQVMLHVDLPHNEPNTTNMIDNTLATVVHASKCAVNHKIQMSPGAMVFNIDMMINVPLIVNLMAIGN